MEIVELHCAQFSTIPSQGLFVLSHYFETVLTDSKTDKGPKAAWDTCSGLLDFALLQPVFFQNSLPTYEQMQWVLPMHLRISS